MVWNPQSKSCEFPWDGRCVELKFVHFSDFCYFGYLLFVFMSFRVQSSLKHHILHQLAGEVDASFTSCAIHGHGMQWGS